MKDNRGCVKETDWGHVSTFSHRTKIMPQTPQIGALPTYTIDIIKSGGVRLWNSDTKFPSHLNGQMGHLTQIWSICKPAFLLMVWPIPLHKTAHSQYQMLLFIAGTSVALRIHKNNNEDCPLKNPDDPRQWNSTSASFHDAESLKLRHLLMLPWFGETASILCMSLSIFPWKSGPPEARHYSFLAFCATDWASSLFFDDIWQLVHDQHPLNWE